MYKEVCVLALVVGYTSNSCKKETFFINGKPQSFSNLCNVEEGVLQLTKVGFQLNGLAHFLGVTFILEKMSHV